MASNSRVTVSQVDPSKFDPVEWDANVARAEASMRSAHNHACRLGLKFTFRGTPRVFHVYLEEDGQKTQIGHYILITRLGAHTFYDGLNLYPEHRTHWAAAMEAAIRQARGGVFDYGWQWSIEEPRDTALQTIPGVELLSNRPILVQGVDFSRWTDWDSYYKDISTNVRYDARSAEKRHPDLKVVILTGLSTLKKVPALLAMRQALYRRKGLPFRTVRVGLGYLFGILICPQQAMIAYAEAGGRMLAMHYDTEFGEFHYHLDAATAEGIGGEGRYLQLAVLRRAFELAPKGKFLVGYTDLPLEDQSAKGLLQSRRFLRVSDWPTNLIRFSYKFAG